jgi:hypothetical protein
MAAATPLAFLTTLMGCFENNSKSLFQKNCDIFEELSQFF